MVNDLVTNGVICSVYFFKDRGCDEMTSIRLQAKLTYDLQAYVDRMYGGPGKGWFRVVTDSAQAREVIEQGKLAVVLGVETSEPFGCKQVLDVPQCDREDIDKGLDELYALGVRSMFLCHKFDNALCGVRFDSGALGTAINVGQFLSTGTFWRTEKCTGPQSDNPIGLVAAPGAERKLPAGVSLPRTTATRGATSGADRPRRVRGARHDAARHDARDRPHERQGHRPGARPVRGGVLPGVLSSHSWMDLNWTERVYGLGGFVAQYMHGSEQFAAEAERTDALREKYGVGYGYGTDMNGVGGWPAPRGADSGNPVRYPFRSADGGSVIDRQTTGERTWDLNTDGAAHHGLVPDWIEDIRLVGGRDVVDDLFRGAESYLDTWGASERHRAAVNLAAGRRPRPVPRSGTRSRATRPGAPSTATAAPAGRAAGATSSGCASIWAPPTGSAASPSTGSAHTAGRTGSRCPPTASGGAPSGPRRPATAAWTPSASRPARPATSA